MTARSRGLAAGAPWLAVIVYAACGGPGGSSAPGPGPGAAVPDLAPAERELAAEQVTPTPATAPPAAAPAPAAAAATDDEGTRVATAIEKALTRHAGDVHRCFELALADRLDAAGKLEVEVTIGAGGRVKEAALVSKADKVSPGLSDCVLRAAKGWTVPDIEEGAAVVLPFTLGALAQQFVVNAADVPARGPVARGGGAAAFAVKILLDPVNVRAPDLSLTLLTVSPASRVAMHRHPQSEKAIYLLRGKARILGARGDKPLALSEGDLVLVPRGYPHVIENMGRQIPAEMLQVFSPAGPERVYRDPKDPAGRAAFEVVRDANPTVPPGAKLTLASGKDGAATPGEGKSTVRSLLQGPAFSVAVVEAPSAALWARRSNNAESEAYFLLAGGGTLTVGAEVFPFSAGSALFVPARQPFAVKFTGGATGEKTLAVRVLIPAPAR